MRSCVRLKFPLWLVLLITAASPCGQSARAAVNAHPPTEAELTRAIEVLNADRNLGAERTVKRLKWMGDEQAPSQPPGWLTWLAQFFSWVAQVGRLVLWVVGALLTALLAFLLYRYLRDRGPRAAREKLVVPTHVGELDIRPESLPDDIGAAVLQLWEHAEHRAALAVLYRGLLSRLVHAHRVPIHDSSTEGECIALAARHLSPQRSQYASRLVRVWQRAVYGGLDPETDTVRALCAGFASALEMQAEPQATDQAA